MKIKKKRACKQKCQKKTERQIIRAKSEVRLARSGLAVFTAKMLVVVDKFFQSQQIGFQVFKIIYVYLKVPFFLVC